MNNIDIYNVLGEKIYEQAISDKRTANSSNGYSLIPIDLSEAPSGIYFLKITSAQNQTFATKIIFSE